MSTTTLALSLRTMRPDVLTVELARVVQETLQPEGVSVWLLETKSPKGVEAFRTGEQ